MTLNKNEAQVKLEKLAHNPETFQFALSPNGFLLIAHGKNFEVADFKLFHQGRYFRRNGFNFMTNLTVPEKGLYLCSYSKGKFIAQSSDEAYEFATAKKTLSEEFSLVLLMRFSEKIVLLLADGKFANEAFLITLADTPSNESFTRSLVRNIVSTRNSHVADMLLQEEEAYDGEE